MKKGRHRHLGVDIRPKLDKQLKKVIYEIIIDGDQFWADTYEHALLTLMEILIRDEFTRSKIC